MARATVLVASRFLLERRAKWDDGYEIVAPDKIASAELAARIEVVVTGGGALDNKLIEVLPNLKLVACFATGYEGIDLAYLRSRGIALTSAGGVNAHDVADHAISLMLAWWHGISAADRSVREGLGRDSLAPRPSLRGKRAGVVGLGRVGQQIARRAEALGLSVSWWGPREKVGADYPRAESLLALATGSDILFIASRASAGNTAEISREILAALGPEGLLVNVSRGSLVDEAALLQALETRAIAGAALDVFAHEPTDPQLWSRFSNVVLSPHIAGYTREGGIAMFAQLRENVRRHFAAETLLTPVEDSI